MRLYVLDVVWDDFEYDETAYAVVLAESEEQAISIAKEARNVEWEVISTREVDRVGLVASYIHYG